MRENRTSGSMRGRWKRATSQRACALLYQRPHDRSPLPFFPKKTSAGVR